jgi:hypothetical protein
MAFAKGVVGKLGLGLQAKIDPRILLTEDVLLLAALIRT